MQEEEARLKTLANGKESITSVLQKNQYLFTHHLQVSDHYTVHCTAVLVLYTDNTCSCVVMSYESEVNGCIPVVQYNHYL